MRSTFNFYRYDFLSYNLLFNKEKIHKGYFYMFAKEFPVAAFDRQFSVYISRDRLNIMANNV